MTFLLRAGTLALAVALAGPTFAQHAGAVQRFPLHKAIAEPGITACVSQEIPIRINTLLAEGAEAEATKAYEAALVEGKCINGTGVVVYTRQVHRVDADDGSVWTVYEGNAGRAKFYVPMQGYLHEDRSI